MKTLQEIASKDIAKTNIDAACHLLTEMKFSYVYKLFLQISLGKVFRPNAAKKWG